MIHEYNEQDRVVHVAFELDFYLRLGSGRQLRKPDAVSGQNLIHNLAGALTRNHIGYRHWTR